MNHATVVPTAVPPVKSTIELEDIDCCFTLKACALLTGDAFMCMPCCCFCGGCCGRYVPCIFKIDPNHFGKPGAERCVLVCQVQTLAGVLMPCTICGCLWGCCGVCTPCARGIVQCAMGVERRGSAPVQQQEMKR